MFLPLHAIMSIGKNGLHAPAQLQLRPHMIKRLHISTMWHCSIAFETQNFTKEQIMSGTKATDEDNFYPSFSKATVAMETDPTYYLPLLLPLLLLHKSLHSCAQTSCIGTHIHIFKPSFEDMPQIRLYTKA